MISSGGYFSDVLELILGLAVKQLWAKVCSLATTQLHLNGIKSPSESYESVQLITEVAFLLNESIRATTQVICPRISSIQTVAQTKNIFFWIDTCSTPNCERIRIWLYLYPNNHIKAKSI